MPSISSASPKPFNITLRPAPAKARAIPRPMPLVEPVITAFLAPTAGLTRGVAKLVVMASNMAALPSWREKRAECDEPREEAREEPVEGCHTPEPNSPSLPRAHLAQAARGAHMMWGSSLA